MLNRLTTLEICILITLLLSLIALGWSLLSTPTADVTLSNHMNHKSTVFTLGTWKE